MSEERANRDGHLTLSPKMSFVLGMVGGVMFLCTIGFFILLSIVIKGGVGSAAVTAPSTTAPSPTAAVAPSNDNSGDQIGTVTPVSSSDHVWGPDSAPVTLILYSDIECPYCGRFHPTIKQIEQDYPTQVRVVYRHFPLSFHPEAKPAAVASECADEQGKFWEFIDAMYNNQSSLGDAFYKSTAQKLGLNTTKFNSCLTSGRADAKIAADQASGAQANVTGTPATIIIGADGSKQLIPGALPYESVKPMIDAAL